MFVLEPPYQNTVMCFLHGVPQSSVLGPYCLQSSSVIFCKVFILQLLIYLLMTLNAFSQSHHQTMLLNCKGTSILCPPGAIFPTNETKFVHLCFCKNQLTHLYIYRVYIYIYIYIYIHIYTHMVNSKLIKTSQYKDLCVNFSNNLHWAKHYEIIIVKAYQTLGLIRHIFVLNSLDARKQLYISLVQSRLLYCSPLWRPQLLKDIICFRISSAKSH